MAKNSSSFSHDISRMKAKVDEMTFCLCYVHIMNYLWSVTYVPSAVGKVLIFIPVFNIKNSICYKRCLKHIKDIRLSCKKGPRTSIFKYSHIHYLNKVIQLSVHLNQAPDFDTAA